MGTNETGRELLHARVEDAVRRAESGVVARLPFLTPRDSRRAFAYLARRGAADAAWTWGGYPEAERACLFLLPDYLLSCLPAAPMACDAKEVLPLLSEEVAEEVQMLRVRGSGFRTLSHRDYLGAILHLGIERDAIGDLCVQNDHEAILFCSRVMASFLCEHLERVAADAVKLLPLSGTEPDFSFTDGRRYAPVRDTVASERLDCAVAALCNCSREEAQEAIRRGEVEVEYETEERVDVLLSPPAVLVVRGKGKFILRAFDGETRKGRLRLVADRLL